MFMLLPEKEIVSGRWEDSPEHNENMLGKRHHAHGTAFYLGKEGIVYGTDLLFLTQMISIPETLINN